MNDDADNKPSLTIIIPAFNEEASIKQRIDNLLKVDYPDEKMEIIVASDGSSDSTVEVAGQFADRGVRVLDFKENRGRAVVQNEAVLAANGEVVVFTDAETEFAPGFLKEMIASFNDPSVGCVVGNLIYRTRGTSVSESEGFYWRFEKRLRALESRLGILATATGACMAVRKGLWRKLSPIDDSDFTTPLDVILQNFRVVYVPEALAYDTPTSSVKGEIRTRIRQTSKNLVGTCRRWRFRGCFTHPLISLGLLSHKIFRWLTPFFMFVLFFSNIFLLAEGRFYMAGFSLQALFYMGALLGWIGESMKIRLPVASTIFSFCVANIGMGVGVFNALVGKVPTAYKKTQ